MRNRGLRFKLIASLGVLVLVPLLALPFAAISISGPEGETVNGSNLALISVAVFITVPLLCCALWMSRLITVRILRPLDELTRAAERIVEGRLDEPVEYRSGDEIGRLSEVFELMRARLQQSKDRQQAYEQERNDLITSISHDLRTPLASIRGYVEGLQDGVARDKERFDRYLAVIRDKTDKLDGLIEDLFRFSKMESGQLVIEQEEYECAELLEKLICPLELELAESGISLAVLRPFPGGRVRADPARLAQVFANLLDNAVKYAGDKACILLAAVRLGESLEITVADNGPAIDPVDMPYLFERFYRGDKSRSSGDSGSGLGLAICKYIIEAHGGEIGLRAGAGPQGGNEFFFRLPLLKSKNG